jgi:hypothetical protein
VAAKILSGKDFGLGVQEIIRLKFSKNKGFRGPGPEEMFPNSLACAMAPEM